MGKDDYGPISQYNSLTDPNLQGYFSKSIIRNHLKQSGLINKRGEIIPEEVRRQKLISKEKMETASRMIASKIVQQAIEIKNIERAEIRRKLEEVAKKELVRRVRGKSAQDRELPLLWATKTVVSSDRPTSDMQRPPHLQHKDASGYDDDFDEIQLGGGGTTTSSTMVGQPSRPRKLRPLRQKSLKRQQQQGHRSYSAHYKQQPQVSIPPPTILTMIYYGMGIKIPYDTRVFESKDEIAIYQQHCGGENLLVYSGMHEAGEKFKFKSRRHKEFPFSLTIYVNGTYDCRISTCCEYRHRLNARIGGKTGRFGFTNVIGDYPCIKCLMERTSEENGKATRQKAATKNDKQPQQPADDFAEIQPILDQQPTQPSNANGGGTTIVPFRSGGSESIVGDGEYDQDFEPAEGTQRDDDDQIVEDEIAIDSDERATPAKGDYKWTLSVLTESKKSASHGGPSARVQLKIIGTKGISDLITIGEMNGHTFAAGSTERFYIATHMDLGTPTHVVLHFKDTGSFDWCLNKMQLLDEHTRKLYTFTFGDLVKRNHDIKIAVDDERGSASKSSSSKRRGSASQHSSAPNSRLEIRVKHYDDPDSDAEMPPKPRSPLANEFTKASAKSGGDDNNQWLVRVFTSSGHLRGTDANVYVSLIGVDGVESERIWLTKKQATDKRLELFEQGVVNEFSVQTTSGDKPIKRLHKLRVGHDNSGSFAGWHLNKIEVVNVATSATYTFACNRWLAKSEDDGRIERLLHAQQADEDDDDGGEDKKKKTKTKPAGGKQQQPQPPQQSSSRSSNRDNELDSKSLRLSANDLINEINSKQRTQVPPKKTDDDDASSIASSSNGRHSAASSANNSQRHTGRTTSDSSIRSVGATEQRRVQRLTGPDVQQIISNEMNNSSNGSKKKKTTTTTKGQRRDDSAATESDVSSFDDDFSEASKSKEHLKQPAPAQAPKALSKPHSASDDESTGDEEAERETARSALESRQSKASSSKSSARSLASLNNKSLDKSRETTSAPAAANEDEEDDEEEDEKTATKQRASGSLFGSSSSSAASSDDDDDDDDDESSLLAAASKKKKNETVPSPKPPTPKPPTPKPPTPQQQQQQQERPASRSSLMTKTDSASSLNKKSKSMSSSSSVVSESKQRLEEGNRVVKAIIDTVETAIVVADHGAKEAANHASAASVANKPVPKFNIVSVSDTEDGLEVTGGGAIGISSSNGSVSNKPNRDDPSAPRQPYRSSDVGSTDKWYNDDEDFKDLF